MKYIAVIKKPLDILEIIGFQPVSTGNGYELPLQNPNRKTKVEEDVPRRRFHAFITDNEIDVHQDRPSGRTHKAHNFNGQRKEICQLFERIDKGYDYKNTKAHKYLSRHSKYYYKLK